MQILIYECAEAPEKYRFCAKLTSNGKVMPVTAYRSTQEGAKRAAEGFIETEMAKRAGQASPKPKPKAATKPVPSVQTPKPAASIDNDFEDLL